MYKNNITVGSGAKGTSSLVRAKFGPGMLLHHDDLDALNAYTRELSRLMFKSLFGCGVICGLVVEAVPGGGSAKITVGAGVALDCNGDPIYVPRDQPFALDDNCDRPIDGPLWIVLYGTVACCSPRTAVCSPDDDERANVMAMRFAWYAQSPNAAAAANGPAAGQQRHMSVTACVLILNSIVTKTITAENADAVLLQALNATAHASCLPS
jgi:hypothetical protein